MDNIAYFPKISISVGPTPEEVAAALAEARKLIEEFEAVYGTEAEHRNYIIWRDSDVLGWDDEGKVRHGP